MSALPCPHRAAAGAGQGDATGQTRTAGQPDDGPAVLRTDAGAPIVYMSYEPWARLYLVTVFDHSERRRVWVYGSPARVFYFAREIGLGVNVAPRDCIDDSLPPTAPGLGDLPPWDEWRQ